MFPVGMTQLMGHDESELCIGPDEIYQTRRDIDIAAGDTERIRRFFFHDVDVVWKRAFHPRRQTIKNASHASRHKRIFDKFHVFGNFFGNPRANGNFPLHGSFDPRLLFLARRGRLRAAADEQAAQQKNRYAETLAFSVAEHGSSLFSFSVLHAGLRESATREFTSLRNSAPPMSLIDAEP